MTNWKQDSAQNGTIIHYFSSQGERCHPGIIAGNCLSEDGVSTTADIIQLDNVEEGVIVPLRRNAIPYDEGMSDTQFPANGTWHGLGCLRAPVEI